MPIRAALIAAEPRPPDDSAQKDKRNYAERLSRLLATVIANGLRSHFEGITPDSLGAHQEAPAAAASGFKKLDVNFSTPQLGMALGISVKTVNFPDAKTGRYTHNRTRIDNELRAEAMDYHVRQPYSVLVGVLFLPAPAANGGKISSFARCVETLHHRAGREKPTDEAALLERAFVALYESEGKYLGNVGFFDVMNKPPSTGVPTLLSIQNFLGEIVATFKERNPKSGTGFRFGPPAVGNGLEALRSSSN